MSNADVRKTRRVGKAHVLPTAPAYTFGGRNERPVTDPGPGPGEYGPAIDFTRKGAGFGTSSRYSSTAPLNPGPNEYSPTVDPVRRSTASFSFGGKPKPKDLHKTPGPGAYEPSTSGNMTKPRMPAYSLQARWAAPLDKDKKPGPAEYDPQAFQPKESPGVSIKLRHEGRGNETSPGPVYDVNRAQEALTKKPGKSFGTSRPARDPSNGVPGAAEYMYDVQPVKPKRATWSMPRSARDMGRDTGVPGPGSYLQAPLVDRSAGHSALSPSVSSPAHVIAGRYIKERDPMSPGPGSYSPSEQGSSLRRSAPAFSLTGAVPKDRREKVPGPGAYDPDRATDMTHPASVPLFMATRPEDYPDKERRPAPGAYDPQLPQDASPGVSLKFRHERKFVEDTPAPHDYADKDFRSIYLNTGQLRNGFSFGRKPRPAKRDAVPGPIYSIGCSTLGIAANSEPMTAAETNRVAVL